MKNSIELVSVNLESLKKGGGGFVDVHRGKPNPTPKTVIRGRKKRGKNSAG